MGLSFLGVTYESIVTAYDDESTPLNLTGKKMLPIIVDDNGLAKNESLDILKDADTNNLLHWESLQKSVAVINPFLDEIGSLVHSLAMPYWIWTPEFNNESRVYFQKKKEVKRGPFRDLVKKQNIFANDLNQLLINKLSPEIKKGFYKSESLTIMDIMIAAHLWGMYVVPEFQFAEDIHHYLQSTKALTHFNYHEDYWA